jgi:simple sugar transport system ATP-binding protein
MTFISQVKKKEKSCILITHNIGHAYHAADRFVLMDRGKVEGVYEKDKFSLKDLTEKLIEIAS